LCISQARCTLLFAFGSTPCFCASLAASRIRSTIFSLSLLSCVTLHRVRHRFYRLIRLQII
jgi:hypothetical protein